MATPSSFTSSSSGEHSARWRGFVRLSLATMALMAVLSYGLVLLVDPYASMPVSLDYDRVQVGEQQRLFYPGLARKARFDSALIGNSNIRLLRPDILQSELGGSWVNLAMNAASPWEQQQIFDVFLRARDEVANVLVGLDYLWCNEAYAGKRFVGHRTRARFPYWLFDDNPWNDIPPLNLSSLQHAWLQASTALGLREKEYGDDGYTIFTDPQSDYDVKRARVNIYGSPQPKKRRRQLPPVELTPTQLQAMPFTELERLSTMLQAMPEGARKILFFVPYHTYYQAPEGSENAAMWRECKRRVVEIASALDNAYVLDFMIHSGITRRDRNYWDHKHYTVEVGDAISALVGSAVRDGKSGDDYRLLFPPEAVSGSGVPSPGGGE